MNRTDWELERAKWVTTASSAQAQATFLMGLELQRIADALEKTNKGPQALVHSVQGHAILGDLTETQIEALRLLQPKAKEGS